jgi:hypothetical protein
MTITFKIEETVSELLYQMKAEQFAYDWIETSIPEVLFGLSDKDFHSIAHVDIMPDDSIKIHTAWSGFKYHITSLPEGGSKVVYKGAYKGLMQQSLFPRMTTVFTGIDTVKTSTGKYMTLACYQAEKGGHCRIRYEGYITDAQKHCKKHVTEIADQKVAWSFAKDREGETKCFVKFKDGSFASVEGSFEDYLDHRESTQRRKRTEVSLQE